MFGKSGTIFGYKYRQVGPDAWAVRRPDGLGWGVVVKTTKGFAAVPWRGTRLVHHRSAEEAIAYAATFGARYQVLSMVPEKYRRR